MKVQNMNRKIQHTEQFERHQVVQILSDLGYRLRSDGNGWRSRALYRNGQSQNSLKINPNGTFIDFPTGDTGSLYQLVALTIGQSKAKNYFSKIETPSVTSFEDDKGEILFMKNIDKKILTELLPRHSYWVDRGISLDLIKKFKGGEMHTKGRFKGRYVFPIFDAKEDILGLSGRLLHRPNNDLTPKWKHYNGKTRWKYPLFLNYSVIKNKKSVIIVESIGDCLSLMEMGINNVIVSFGLDVSYDMINLFLRYNLEKIYIAFNNDKNQTGNQAAEKMKNKIGRLFPPRTVNIALPDQVGEDFNSLLLKDKDIIAKWHKEKIYE